MILAKELSRSNTLFGTIHFTSNVPALSGEYQTEQEFKAAVYKYNKDTFRLHSIEFIGLLNKWALHNYFGSFSSRVHAYAHQLSDEFMNFWDKAPEKQGEATTYLCYVIDKLLPKVDIHKKNLLHEYRTLFSSFYEQYLAAFEPYNNAELCK